MCVILYCLSNNLGIHKPIHRAKRRGAPGCIHSETGDCSLSSQPKSLEPACKQTTHACVSKYSVHTHLLAVKPGVGIEPERPAGGEVCHAEHLKTSAGAGARRRGYLAQEEAAFVSSTGMLCSCFAPTQTVISMQCWYIVIAAVQHTSELHTPVGASWDCSRCCHGQAASVECSLGCGTRS